MSRTVSFGLGCLLLVISAAAAGPPVALSAASASAAATSEPVTLKVAAGSFPDYLDPQLSYTAEGSTAMYNTYVPLLTFRHGNGRAGADVVPGLAKGLPELTAGGRTYTLFLRRGLRYSDGTAVRASDFEYAIKRLFKVHSGGSPLYYGIVGARRYERTGRGGISGIAADNQTGRIVIHLVEPSGTFTDLLAMTFAAPVPPDTPTRERFRSPPAATGPYAFDRVTLEGWSYVRNPAWDAGNGRLLPQLPGGQMDRIEVSVVRSREAQLEGVRDGGFDWVQGPLPRGRRAEFRRHGVQLRVEPTLNTYYFWMNTKRPPFDDIRVRKAANHAIDPAVMRSIYGGLLTPSQQILPPGMPGYRRYDLFPYDLDKARRLVAAADPADREVTVWAVSESTQAAAAAYYRSQLQKIGLHAHLKVVDAYAYFTAIGRRSTPNLDTGWSSWFADYPHPDDFFRPTLLGASILPGYNGNFAEIAVPTLDATIEALGKRPLNRSRERRYAALDRSYMKLAPWAPYGNYAFPLIVSKAVDLRRLVFNPMVGVDLASFRFR